MDRADLNADIRLDPDQLDVEAARQAETFYKWARLYGEARALVDRKEFEMELLEAHLQMQAREDPEKFGIKSITETAVKSAIKICKPYVEAMHAFIEAKREAELLAKAVVAMEQKKRMIEVMITLHGQSYFAGPTTPRDLSSAWQEYQQGRSSYVNERQRGVAHKRVIKEE